MKKIKVLIIDDSALVRKILSDMLAQEHDIEVVGVAPDPFIAREKIKLLNPDVLTLDVEMPRMDGITFLGNLMRLRPMPVIMVSTLTEKGADVTLQALELGAVDYVAKPKVDLERQLVAFHDEIVEKIRMAANVNIRQLNIAHVQRVDKNPKIFTNAFKTTNRLVAIGSSTGGTEAIKEILQVLPADFPAIVIAQHIPDAFSKPFAKRMDTVTRMSVCEAEDGQQIVSGHVYIAPGHSHLRVARDGAKLVCRLGQDPPVNRHRPSVDVLFDSVAENVGVNALGVILTGMGGDGAQGMKKMRDAGAYTIAQDEKTCVVFGMPKEAIRHGGVVDILPLDAVADQLIRVLQES
ncbi:MAG: chemotaxis response regulator protein-glutamate methylesterase [Pseudomonadota bacterium]